MWSNSCEWHQQLNDFYFKVCIVNVTKLFLVYDTTHKNTNKIYAFMRHGGESIVSIDRYSSVFFHLFISMKKYTFMDLLNTQRIPPTIQTK